MQKEKHISKSELAPLAMSLAETFIQRWDLYPQQLNNGAYICVKKALTPQHILAHLQGELTLGVYLLASDSTTRFVVIDADDEAEYTQVVQLASSLQHQGVPAYLERSRRGGHLWFFFEEPVPGKDARQFGRGLIRSHQLPEKIELYPKQDELKQGPGSLIRLPFGIHRKDGKRYGFVNPTGQKIAPLLRDQIPLLSQPQTVSERAFDTFWELGQPPQPQPEFRPREVASGTLSARIKQSISVYAFVSQYVELKPNGRGLCPFHEDEQASFSVSEQDNYWHCFAGCGGGSLIDFWMRYQDCDFKQAVRQLSQMLLK